jgi:hypothetical protein
MAKYWWIIRTDDNCGSPYDTFIKWYNLPRLFYWLVKYKNTNYSCSFTWVDMESNIGESDIFVVRRNNGLEK